MPLSSRFIWKYFVEDFTLKHLLLFEICPCHICKNFVYKHSEYLKMFVHKIRFRPLFKLETQNYKKRQRHVSMFLLTMNHENQWHSARKWINQCYSTSECCQVDFVHRRSRPEVYCKKGVLRNFVKLTGKYLCWSLFFNKVYQKSDSGTGVFPWILQNL